MSLRSASRTSQTVGMQAAKKYSCFLKHGLTAMVLMMAGLTCQTMVQLFQIEKLYYQPTGSQSDRLEQGVLDQPLRPQQHQHQRLILLAGPHKAASTSLQTNAIQFASVYHQKWNWINPPSMKQLTSFGQFKNFAALMFSLTSPRQIPQIHQSLTSQQILDIYRNEIQEKWNAGFSILIGNEEIDRVVADSKDFDGEQVLDRVLRILPEGADISVVIVYRAPRINHLVSLWKEIIYRHDHSFYEFILDEGTYMELHAIDSLRLVDTFLKRGLKVDLIDLSGFASRGYQLYSVLGCDVMREPCDEKKIPVRLQRRQRLLGRMRKRRNVKEWGVKNATDTQLVLMDNILRDYDCTYRTLLGHPNLTVHYGDLFEMNMKRCQDNHRPMSRKEMLSSLRRIVLELH